MNFEEKEFIPVLLGGDVNVYCMARSFYEAFNVKSILVGKFPIYPTIYTNLFETIYDEKLESQDVLLSILDKIDEEYPDKKKILLGNNDNYVRLIIESKEHLKPNFIAPYIDIELFDRLIIKEHFYNMCEQYGLDYPATYIFKCSKESNVDIELPFAFPVAVKASDTVIYSKYKFEGKRKGYIAHNKEELDHILKIVCDSGYDDSLIIQDFVPGDDSNMSRYLLF
jgi:D-aspartate ligase